jgi:hypothetical protein
VGNVSYWYAQEALKQATPPEPTKPLIAISVILDANLKIMLVATESGKFELLRGTLAKTVYDSLYEIEKTSGLPASPHDAAKLLPMKWETKVISADRFAAIHRDFTTAFSELMANAGNSYNTVLTDGGVVVLHASRYFVTYDNGGYVHGEATVDDAVKNPMEKDPMANWVHQISALCKDSFKR